ncbi:MAG: glycosyltransferase [Candidatus Magasanikbacteria bacterium]|jgi:glycosyltransferase involved in cell wall biosynthesis|nr:glycosyltransferase [Candidatus Magasanikbacteria bacterium]MBT4314958.1 glycosyltransferase [Candidatus Magasanikbacteria bacterium]MBT4546914.1 glycosyltransferase [Candidatus Magasanikbacteria bacterium]MBT6819172.1 glycosyltransferase [Candidatus Magasanikbacteria bacterium]
MAKVCLINNLYGDNAVGGAEIVVQARALEYKKKGDSVIVITTKADKNPKIEKNNENGITVYRVWIPNIFYYKDLSKHGFVLKLIWHFIDIFKKPKAIEEILVEEKPDVVETHNLMGIGYEFVPTGHLSSGRVHSSEFTGKWIHYLHDVQLVEPSGVLPWNHEKDNVWQRIYSGIMKRKFIGVGDVISPSRFLKKFYEERGFFKNAEWNVVVGNRHACSVQRRQDVPNQKYLFVGSLVKHKGIRILMQAWDKVGGDKEFHIAGDGVLREELESWAYNKNNVKVYGRLEGEDLESIYKKCSTLIFPSICIENNPTVIHEAHEHGLKVIASDTGGVREIVCEDDILVEPGNIEELVGKI